MNAALFHRPRRHMARGMAAFFALMMVASNALAVMGLCVVKAPHPALDARAVAAVATTAVDIATEPGCPQHVDTAAAQSAPQEPAAAAAHCTQDDPGAQVRANDIPPAALDAVPALQRITPVPACVDRGAAPGDDQAPVAPLYTRLSRLLL